MLNFIYLIFHSLGKVYMTCHLSFTLNFLSMVLIRSTFREEHSNTLRILVATDVHLGYMEKDEIRRHDSFQAFEEICSIAEKKQVIDNI